MVVCGYLLWSLGLSAGIRVRGGGVFGEDAVESESRSNNGQGQLSYAIMLSIFT